MNQKLKNIFLLYFRNQNFLILSILSFLALCAMQAVVYWGIQKNLWDGTLMNVNVGQSRHIEILAQKYILGEELLNTTFILGLWVMFILGLLIKKQFANDRASLLPGYRFAHIITTISILAVMVGVTVAMSQSAMTLSQSFFLNVMNTAISLWAIYLIIIFMALTMLYLGYLSMGHCVVIGYILLAMVGQNIVSILQFLSTNLFATYSATLILILAFVLFIYRLFTLKSENFEYPFLLSWPPQKTLRNQAALEEWVQNFKIRALKIIGISAKESVIPAFYQLPTTWARVTHWGYADQASLFSLFLFSIIGLPLYFVFLKSPGAEFIINAKAQNNFLLLAGSAVLITILTNYKAMIFWNYDLLKPVSRKDFFKQQGIKFFSNLLIYWVIIAVYFAIFPDLISGAKQIGQNQFWAFLFLTFSFSSLCLAWLATLSAMRNERLVIANGLVLCLLIMSEFFWAGKTPTQWLVLNATLCLILCGLFFKLAFEKWMKVEF